MGFWKGFLTFMFVLLVIFMLGSYWMGFTNPDGISLSKEGQNNNFSAGDQNDSLGTIEKPNQSQDSDFKVSGSEEFQFYENLRYRDNEISYGISDECTLGKEEDAINALGILEDRTILEFYEDSENPEIFVACQSRKEPKGNTFVAGEGGPVNITQSGDFNVIYYGEILLIEESSKSCPEPNVALHEFLHALGFKHSSNPNNILYDTSKCGQELGEDLPKIINELYEVPSQPDLVLENVDTNTHARYLDFNASIRNNGLANARDSSLKVYTDEELLKSIDVSSLKIGFGTKIVSKNIRFSSTNFDELRFELETNQEELNKENNKINFKQEK